MQAPSGGQRLSRLKADHDAFLASRLTSWMMYDVDLGQRVMLLDHFTHLCRYYRLHGSLWASEGTERPHREPHISSHVRSQSQHDSERQGRDAVSVMV